MSEFNIEVAGGKSVRLPTAGKYCDRDILVTATGGGDTDAAYQEGLAEGIEQGKQEEYDRFWDAFQENGTRQNYALCFAGTCWNSDTMKPKYPVVTTNGFEMFRSCGEVDLTKVGVVFDFSRCTNFSNFAHSSFIIRFGEIDTTSATSLGGYSFQSCVNLETIDKLILKQDGTQALGGTSIFNSCSALKNIVIEGVIGGSISFKDSPLTRASIESVMAALSSTATGVTATFKKTAVNSAFTTDEWNALCATKTNWTITLS